MNSILESEGFPDLDALLKLRGKDVFRPIPSKCEGGFEVVPGMSLNARLGSIDVVVTAFFDGGAHKSRRGKAICRHLGEKEKRFFVDVHSLSNFVIQTQGWQRARDEHELVLRSLRQ